MMALASMNHEWAATILIYALSASGTKYLKHQVKQTGGFSREGTPAPHRWKVSWYWVGWGMLNFCLGNLLSVTLVLIFPR